LYLINLLYVTLTLFFLCFEHVSSSSNKCHTLVLKRLNVIGI